MVNSISNSGNINPIQMLRAANAFKNTEKPEEINLVEPSEGTNVNENSILADKDVNEIKLFAKIAGEENLSNDDIKYGVTYGRSVIADYMI